MLHTVLVHGGASASARHHLCGAKLLLSNICLLLKAFSCTCG